MNSSKPLSFAEKSDGELNKDVQSFFHNLKYENGVHSFEDNDKNTIFLYLNERNVIQGEKAVYFTDFDVQADDDTLKIFYESDKTLDYSDESKRRELYYKVNLDKKYDYIKLFNNGEETHFGAAGS